jgi:Fe-S cluster biogenesis protein NfuA
MQDTVIRGEVEAVEGLLTRLDELPAGPPREEALEAVSGLLRLYGEALRRVVQAVGPASEVRERLLDDELVSHLLLLHDLHPATVYERVAGALEEVTPYIRSHGGGIELVEIADGVARIRLHGHCQGCRASTQTLKLAVEESVLRAAPELHAVEAVDQQAPTHDPPAALPMYGSGALR